MTVSQRRFFLSLLVVAVVGVNLPSQTQPDKTAEGELAWKFKKDQEFFQSMKTDTNQTMKVQGTDVVQNQSQTFFFKWKVADVKGDDVTLEQTITGLKMTIDIGGSKISYDSTTQDPAATTNPLNKFFASLSDSKTVFKVTYNTKEMKVKDITGHEEFVKKLSEANPQMKPLLERILSKKALQDMSEPIFAALPGGKKTKGNEWTRKSELDMGPIGSYQTTYTYTYDGPDKDKNEKVNLKTDLKYKAPQDDKAGNLPFRIKSATLEGKDGTGEILFDAKAGWVKTYKVSQRLVGKLDIEIGQQTTSVDLDQTQKTEITTTEKDPNKKP
jgi:hypothetical protein